ncbi:YibE/F family protein [Jeotgalibacillus proteolyticus]|uniref:YibE/F family protein n=1 Tax=Jeotgalibacillus proteolyticus TaxID=2082395 RepID=A0A2S5G997_9BACL|nr:YibE/F family protein [Jeotgalibacillus proteolyticus]PPA69558.1 YibE/F family protein [Jeotgalibacillus proteolyticus]
MFKLLTFILFAFLAIPSSALAANTLPPSNPGEQEMMQENIPDTHTTTARVLEVIEEGTELDEMTQAETEFQQLNVEILSGEYKGQEMEVTGFNYPNSVYGSSNFWFKEGDRITIQLQLENGEITNAYPLDYARDFPSYILVGLFIALLLLFGKLKGAKSVITLGLTIFILFKFMIPYLLEGHNPILLVLITGAIVTALTFLIVSGFSRKTLASIIGTVGGLGSAALISVIFMGLMNLSGFHGEDERMLGAMAQELPIDLSGLLLAGIIIGALGAVMDVAISIASSIEEVKRNYKKASFKELFKSGMNVGGDIMGTMANTLILAYVGASLPILLLIYAYEYPYGELIQMEFFGVEILRTLAGSIGLVLAIPITALISALLLSKQEVKTKQDPTIIVGDRNTGA